MAEATEWTIEWYRTGTAEVPAQMFLQGLAGRPRDEAFVLLELVQRRGNQLRKPKSAALGDGLFELRGHQVRLFYVFRPGRRVIILDGMVKKRDDIPNDVMARLRQMQQALAAAESRAKRAP